MFTQSQLTHALSGQRLGHLLYYFPTIGSTNDEAKRLAMEGAPEGTMVVADEQTSGRGRSGRAWITQRGTDLASTFLLRPDMLPVRVGVLSLVGGLAAARAIEEVTGLTAQIKWPNDVFISDRKVCGVLAETNIENGRVGWVALGIGINVNLALPEGKVVQHLATSLAAEIGREVNRLRLLVTLSKTLDEIYGNLGGRVVADACESRMLWHGRLVRVMGSDTSVVDEGLVVGLTDDGALRLRRQSGREVSIRNGDVSLVPKQQI